MLSTGVVFGQQSWLVSMPVGASFGFHRWNNPLGGLVDGPAESTALCGAGNSVSVTAISSARKRPQRRALRPEKESAETAIRSNSLFDAFSSREPVSTSRE